MDGTLTQKQTVLLVEPPFYRLYDPEYSLDKYPLALGYLAEAMLRETPYKPVVFNADFFANPKPLNTAWMAERGSDRFQEKLKNPTDPIWDETFTLIDKIAPVAVCFTVKTQNAQAVVVLAERIKSAYPDLLIVVGGPAISLDLETVMQCQAIDIAIPGEGEATLVDLLNTISRQEKYDDVAGLVYRREGQLIRTPARELIADLDALGFPHEHAEDVLIDYEHYSPAAFRSIFAIRGCPYACHFCGSRYIWTRKVRFRSVDHVTEEINRLSKKGIRIIRFDDDTFGVRKEYILELCEAISRKCSKKMSWTCELHANLVDDEILRAMKKAGCYRVTLGVESGCDRILTAMKKMVTRQQLIDACEAIRRQRLELSAFIMFGYFGETVESIEETLDFLKIVKPNRVIYSIFTPYPGTDSWQEALDKGLLGADADHNLAHQRSGSTFCPDIDQETFSQMVVTLSKNIHKLNTRARCRQFVSPWRFRKNVQMAMQIGPKKIYKRINQLFRRQ
jgi:anaerobic magnesium-protoporphyrin IX monomethyl ester cyclase